MNKLSRVQNVTLGCDPEFFFTKNGKVIGSETVIPKHGISADEYGLTVIDGVQAELHPSADLCRERLARNIKLCLTYVDRAKSADIKIDFSPMVEIDKEALDALADENKKFGCASSMNTHKKGKNKVTKVTADPLVYMKRSAGGHIHIGAPEIRNMTDPADNVYKTMPNPTFTILQSPEIIIPVLDILVGNTCVMLDRDPSNVERRKNYGRAGEYRLPKYGIEYRTLSNFWLRGNPIFSLVFGLARQCVEICEQSTPSNDYRKKLLSLVDMEDIIKAINENDFDLACSNFSKIEKFLMEITPADTYGHFPLTSKTIGGFHKLVEKGLDHYFKQDPLVTWTYPQAGYEGGFMRFFNSVLSK